MKVSIMLTSYNLVDYIDVSIRSVIDLEKPFDWELLIGDDGSTDGTVDKIKEWIKLYPQNIKLYQIPRDNSGEKVGSRSAINRAYLLENASGDYLNFLDGDDCFLGTERLIKQVALLETPQYANCSCCGHNIEAYVLSENRKYLGTDSCVLQQVFSRDEYIKQRMYFHTNTIVFRKECKELLLMPLYRNFLNDVFITFLLLQHGNILYLPNAWCRYNMTGNGLWTGHSTVYGYFRNMQLFDLERHVCPELSYVLMDNYANTILYLNKHYDLSLKEEVTPLFQNVDKEIFDISSLLYGLNELTITEKLRKNIIILQAWYHRGMRHLKVASKKCLI